jgi:hypothetical protein
MSLAEALNGPEGPQGDASAVNANGDANGTRFWLPLTDAVEKVLDDGHEH